MAVSVVELLEVVDIHDGDRVLLVKRQERFVESASAANAGEFVEIGQHVRSLDHGRRQDQTGSCHISIGRFANR